jgi:Leucine-rich repeat (LRR) protein
LTALNLSHTSGLVLPSDLGAWLPRLERLIANGSTSAAVPATLSRLTHLDFSYSRAVALSLPSTLTSLRELVLDMAHSTAVATISSFTALEVLDVSDSRVLGPSLTVLQPLTRLRHLSMSGVEGCDPASYTVLGALQQLTRLDLARSDNSEAGCSVLAGTPPLPALKQLDISHRGAEQLAALAPWVSGLTALTMIRMASCVVGEGEALLYLPAQLREVHLAECGLRQLPSGLQRLSALEVLDVSDMRWSFGGSLQQLPGWLSQLGRLEALGLSHTSVTSEQEVLAHMPALRFVRLSRGYEQRVLAQAPHLHFGHSSRLDSW